MEFSEEGLPLCERCSSSIKIEEMFLPGWKYKGEFNDPAEYASDCGLCLLVWEVSRWGTTQTRIHDDSPDDAQFHYFTSYRNGEPPSHYSFSLHTDGETIPPSLKLRVGIYWPTLRADHLIAVFTNENDFVQKLHGLPYIGKVGPSTASEPSFGTARQWLYRCLDGHPEFGLPHRGQHPRRQHFRRVFCDAIDQTGSGPSRVLDCFADAPSSRGHSREEIPPLAGVSPPNDANPLSLKLVDLAETDGNYAALSYCWGGLDYKAYVTTEKNVACRRASIEKTDLPQLFQDAIHVTRNLRIRHLWIDALCILQDWFKPLEDQVDWIKESAKMADIFSGALVTICAASAVGNEGGLFNKSSNTAFDQSGRHISFKKRLASCASSSTRFTLSNGETSVLHFADEERSDWQKRKCITDNCLDK